MPSPTNLHGIKSKMEYILNESFFHSLLEYYLGKVTVLCWTLCKASVAFEATAEQCIRVEPHAFQTV